ncbi:MAG TPA: flagellar hook-basal body complex protein, partial [Limnochordia bacterium]|nr:flagellar hook-basal body complex protein [Limnochordia bacterium]
SDGSSLVLTAELAVGQAEVGPDDTRIKFGTNGSFLGPKPEEAVISFDPAGAESIRIKLDFTQFTQYADTFTGKFLSQNGHTSGALESFTIDQNGVIVGSFSNGLTQALGQVALAKFANPGGLMRSGSTMFMESTNSGSAQVEPAGAPGFGQIIPSALEMSNVDLSEEFTDMIITQRGFQANSRIITTSDEMLQELVNLKR